MLGALKEIVNFIGMIIDFVIQFVTGIVQLLQLIPQMTATLMDSFGLLPSFLVAFASVTVTVAVIFVIVGREGGGEN